MLKLEELTVEQIEALEVMANFNCAGFDCCDCPLNNEHGCGSMVALSLLEND